MVDDFLRLTCNECGQETKHDVLIRREIDRDGDPPFVTDTYELLECRGCEEITLRRLRRFNPFDNTEERTFPSRSARRIPKFVWRLPEDVEALMREVYVALDEGSRRLGDDGRPSCD